MFETSASPVVALSASGTRAGAGVPTKFSDLNSYFQALQTRLSATVALTALVAAAASTVRPLLPNYPPGATPYLVWAGIGALVIAFFLAAGVLAMPGKLPVLIEHRLASRSLGSLDEVDCVLHRAFMKEIRRRHNNLQIVHALLGVSSAWLLSHVTVLLVMTTSPTFSEAPPPGDALCAAIGAPIATSACNWDLFTLVIVVVTSGIFLFGLLYEWWSWWRERRRLAAAAAVSTPAASASS
jgi:hypothetical protein